MLPAMVNSCHLLSWTNGPWLLQFDDNCYPVILTNGALEEEGGKVVAHLAVVEAEEAAVEQMMEQRVPLAYSPLVPVVLNSTKGPETQQGPGLRKD